MLTAANDTANEAKSLGLHIGWGVAKRICDIDHDPLFQRIDSQEIPWGTIYRVGDGVDHVFGEVGGAALYLGNQAARPLDAFRKLVLSELAVSPPLLDIVPNCSALRRLFFDLFSHPCIFFPTVFPDKPANLTIFVDSRR